MTDYVYYVNPAATTGGDGTTDALTGGTCAYQTLNAAITARASTPTGTDTITYRCSGNGSSWIDTTGVDVNGHAAGCLITIEGYNGNYTGRQLGDAYDNTNCYALECSTASTRTLSINDPDVTVRYIQADNKNSSNFYQTIRHYTGVYPFTCYGCRLKLSKSSSSYYSDVLQVIGNADDNAIVYNNTIEGNGSTDSRMRGLYNGNAGAMQAYNNTIYNCGVGIYLIANDASTIQNNAIAACTDDWYNSGAYSGTYSYNADSADGDTPGTNNQTLSTTLTDEFTAPSSGDFTVAANDANNNIWDNGTSGGNIPTVDIVGNSRSDYSIGAWEWVVSVPTLSSPTSSNLQSTTATVGCTVTF